VVYGLSDCWVLNLLFERLECVECWMRVVSANWIRRIRSELLDGWMDGGAMGPWLSGLCLYPRFSLYFRVMRGVYV